MITYTMMKREDLEHCALLAAQAFADYEYFSLYISNESLRQIGSGQGASSSLRKKMKKQLP